jgi:ketosteroid isomerase-like protein
MPSRQSVEAFVARVLSEDHVGAIRDWYHDDAWMQENQAPPRAGGREALMAQEAATLGRAESVKTELVGGPLIDGDTVAIRWRFTFQWKAGGGMQQEEVAWQTWRGEKIAAETFFYDPGQRIQRGG